MTTFNIAICWTQIKISSILRRLKMHNRHHNILNDYTSATIVRKCQMQEEAATNVIFYVKHFKNWRELFTCYKIKLKCKTIKTRNERKIQLRSLHTDVDGHVVLEWVRERRQGEWVKFTRLPSTGQQSSWILTTEDDNTRNTNWAVSVRRRKREISLRSCWYFFHNHTHFFSD